MSTPAHPQLDILSRARKSKGISFPSIFRMVVSALEEEQLRDCTLVDVGCGKGALRKYVGPYCKRYIGVDLFRWDRFPEDAEFFQVDLDSGRSSLPDDVADVVVSLETIEHLENPRAFMRELARLARPGGHVMVSTPNQLSFLSKMTLLLKNEFNEFQDSSYPAHLTALLEVDLKRIAGECGLTDARVVFNGEGRIVFTRRRYPRFLSRMFPRGMSDFVMLIAKKP